MSDFFEVVKAVWPWVTAPFLVIWWASLVRANEAAPEDDPLSAARGCVFALSIVVTLVWVVAFLLWLGSLA